MELKWETRGKMGENGEDRDQGQGWICRVLKWNKKGKD